MSRVCAQHDGPRRDQRAICAAPRASGRPCCPFDLARSAAQIARSSRTQLNCAAGAAGFRQRTAGGVSLRLRSARRSSPLSAPLSRRPQTEARLND